MRCCKHHSTALTADPRFADDDFTRAALGEQRARAAHAHGASLLIAVLGAIMLFGLFRRR